MYSYQNLAREQHRERLRKAQEERTAYQIAELRKAERRQERAERGLLSAWERTERLRAALTAG